MKKSSPVKFAAAIILALFFGASASGMLGFLIPGGELLSCASVFSSMLLAFLFAFGGFIPVSVMAVSMLVTGYFTGGWVIASYLFLIGIIPGAVMIYGSVKGFKFFKQVRNALICEIIVFVILLAAIRALTGMDFAAFFREMWEQTIEMLPAETKDAFADFLNQMINQENAVENEIATQDALQFFSEGIEQTLTVMMPAAMIMYSVINGAFGVLWMNWLRHRRGEEKVQFVPLSGWRMSKQITLGLIIVYIAVLILSNQMPEAGVSAEIIALSAIVIASYIQASASFLSRMRMMGVTAGKRVLFLIVFALMSQVLFPVYGMLSALFGSKGLFTPKMRFVQHEGESSKPENNIHEDKKEENDQNDKEEK